MRKIRNYFQNKFKNFKNKTQDFRINFRNKIKNSKENLVSKRKAFGKSFLTAIFGLIFVGSSLNEVEFLESTTKEVILVKDTSKDTSGNFFVEGFTPRFPRRPSSTGSQKATGMNGQNTGQGGGSSNPGSGGGNSNPGSGSEDGSWSLNSTLKFTPEVINYGLVYRPKTKKQKALEKMKQDLNESIKEENKLNAQRKKQRKGYITVIIKDGMRFFALNKQLRDKFHHAPDLNSPIPETLGYDELARLADPSRHRERLGIFRNRKILPEAYVRQYGRNLRLHILDPNTITIKGTLGANREANGGPSKIDGYHLYNNNTGFDAFFDENGNQFRTGVIVNKGQRDDLKTNGNIM